MSTPTFLICDVNPCPQIYEKLSHAPKPKPRAHVPTHLIKNQDASVLEHGARDGNPLSLSPGKLYPTLSHNGVKSSR